MKKINFKKIKVEKLIDKFEEMDFSQFIGNLVHQNATTIPLSDLAREIYKSEGDITLQDEDYAILMAIFDKMLYRYQIEAIIRSTEDI